MKKTSSLRLQELINQKRGSMNTFPSQWQKEKNQAKANPQDDENEQLYYDSRTANGQSKKTITHIKQKESTPYETPING